VLLYSKGITSVRTSDSRPAFGCRSTAPCPVSRVTEPPPRRVTEEPAAPAGGLNLASPASPAVWLVASRSFSIARFYISLCCATSLCSRTSAGQRRLHVVRRQAVCVSADVTLCVFRWSVAASLLVDAAMAPALALSFSLNNPILRSTFAILR
jgi:hypothetical protein